MSDLTNVIPRLDGWLTVAEAASQLGMTRAGLHVAIQRGEFSSVRRLGRTLILSETEVQQAEVRQPRPGRLPVTPAQAKVLAAILACEDPRGFWGPWPDIRVSRSLRKNGLIDEYWSLTTEGRTVAQLCAARLAPAQPTGSR